MCPSYLALAGPSVNLLPHFIGSGSPTVRQRGSHVMLLRRGERGCAVPLHRGTEKAGALHGVLKQAGVVGADFMNVLRG